MVKGHETGAGALPFFCLALAAHCTIQEKARQEVDKFFGDKENFKDGNITYDAVHGNLKYVERCILETLRLFPSIFLMARELGEPLELGIS